MVCRIRSREFGFLFRLRPGVRGMKHLPKHLRPRWRYVAVGVEAWPDADIDRRSFQAAVRAAARSLLGDAGSAALDISVLAFEFGDGVGDAVLRVRRGEVEPARAALACVHGVDDAPVGLTVRGVSGTVRACEEKYIRRPRKPAEETQVVFENAERRAVVHDDRYDVRVPDGFAGAAAFDFS